MSSELNEQLEAYYKLKHKYEDKIQRLKLKIIRNESLTIKDKRRKVKQLKLITNASNFVIT